MTCQEMVREFHEKFGLPVNDRPTVGTRAERGLRLKLIEEELDEFDQGLIERDIVQIADALADLAYVVYGAAHVFGIDLDAVLAEVHRSNMAKLQPDGTVKYREDGKVLKPEGWTPPDIEGVLNGCAL